MRYKIFTVFIGVLFMSGLALVGAQEENITEDDPEHMEDSNMEMEQHMEQRMMQHMENMEYCIQAMQMMEEMDDMHEHEGMHQNHDQE